MSFNSEGPQGRSALAPQLILRLMWIVDGGAHLLLEVGVCGVPVRPRANRQVGVLEQQVVG